MGEEHQGCLKETRTSGTFEERCTVEGASDRDTIEGGGETSGMFVRNIEGGDVGTIEGKRETSEMFERE